MRRPDPAQRAARNGRACLSGDAEGLRARPEPAADPGGCPGLAPARSMPQQPDSAGSDQTTTRAWNVPPAKTQAALSGQARAPGCGDSSGAAVPGLAEATAAAAAGRGCRDFGQRGDRRRRVSGWADWAYRHQQEHRARAHTDSRLRLLWTSVAPCARSQPRWHMTAHPCQQVLSAVGDERNASAAPRRPSTTSPQPTPLWRPNCVTRSVALLRRCRNALRALGGPPCPATLVIPGLSRRYAAQPRSIPPTGLTTRP